MSGRLILQMYQSIDGFVCGPTAGEVRDIARRDEGLRDWKVERLWQASVHIMDRKLYETMASFWPTVDDPLAAPMNRIPKVVFSKTLKVTPWGPARAAAGNVREEIARLKASASKDILVHGSGAFAQALSREDLIDEYRLLIHPLALGRGKACFRGPLTLRLASSREFASGVVALTYTRAMAERPSA